MSSPTLISFFFHLTYFLHVCAALSYPMSRDDGEAISSGRRSAVRRETVSSNQQVVSGFALQQLELGSSGYVRARASKGILGDVAVADNRHLPYGEMVLIDGAEAYYPLNDAFPTHGDSTVAAWGSAGRLSAFDGIAEGNPEFEEEGLIDSDVGNTAMLFTGVGHQAVRLPGSPLAANRTIELWFKSSALTYLNQTLYMEGDDEAGIHIFARMQDGYQGWENGPAFLYMFAWNRLSLEAPFGTYDSLNSGPIRCEIRQGDRNYIAFVFEDSASGPNYKGFIKKPGSAWSARQCGSTINLPVGASLQHNTDACIGGVCGATRNSVREVIREANSTTNFLEGSYHTFHGTIDEVAIYNIALDSHRMNNHVAAAMA
mmetsp:Transcript_96805/g.153262  ORF Transcript_96805/g.153262 Transcript_96805/m.153262 type:complete len:373 (-) Transcript_96805:60-1178(-)